jgi:Kef-type K+ transport system membrane component KefB
MGDSLASLVPGPLSTFSELALVLLTSALFGAVMVRLKQPLLITYIGVGILLGPAVTGIVHGSSAIEALAQLGVTVLLFIVGLKLDLHHVRHIGPVALATGLGQLAFTIVIGFVITLALGRSWLESLYVAVALTFSSTIIIVKLLSDKRELDSLHGRIAVGFLVVQDLAVVLAMMGMSALRDAGTQDAVFTGVSLVGRIVGAVLLTALLMRWVLPSVLRTMGSSPELLLLFAVAWGVALAAIGEWAGFSKEAGAFVAGFSLASTPFRDAINARLSPLRDFLLLFLFIELGAGLELSALGSELVPAAILSVFVLVGNPLIVLAIMAFMGYRSRTGFLAGLTVAQISEFSILFVAMGISMGHIGSSALALTTLVGITTITVSTYMILYSHPLYARLAPWLRRFERARPFRELEVDTGAPAVDHPEVLLVGLGRYGNQVLAKLVEAEVRVLGIDFDPEVARDLHHAGMPIRFGDGEDADFVESLPVAHAGWLICTLPEARANLAVIRAFRAAGFTGRAVVAARDAVEAMDTTEVHRVFQPFVDAADHAAAALVREVRGARVA